MRKRYKILFVAGVLVLVWKLGVAWWNADELVTLHGKDIPVTDALKSFSKQTHRSILFPASLDQKVTLDLERVPLEEALANVAEQADLWHTRIFVLARNSKQEKEVIQKLSAQTEPPALMRLGRSARWMSDQRPNPGHVTYGANDKPIDSVVADLNLSTDSYFQYAGELRQISVKWEDIPARDAAAQLASLTDTDVERMYQVFPRDRDRERANRPRRSSTSPDGMTEWIEKTNEQIAALPPAEKAAAEEQWKTQQEVMKEFASLTEQQRMERMMQRFTGGNQEERLIQRLKNSTPESRAKRYQRYEARRKSSGSGTPPPAKPKPSAPATP